MSGPGRAPEEADGSDEAARGGAARPAIMPAHTRPLPIVPLRIPRRSLPSPRHPSRRSRGTRYGTYSRNPAEIAEAGGGVGMGAPPRHRPARDRADLAGPGRRRSPEATRG